MCLSAVEFRIDFMIKIPRMHVNFQRTRTSFGLNIFNTLISNELESPLLSTFNVEKLL